jgi:hypothetical protein
MMQKSFLMLVMSFVFGTAAQAQDWEWTLQPQFYIKPYLDFYIFPKLIGNRIAVQKDKYEPFGFVSQRGELVIPTTLEDIFYGFQESLAPVEQNGKWGFIDTSGNWRIPPQFFGVRLFSEGLASVRIDSKYGFIDTSGKWVIEPQFGEVGSFDAGVASVELDDNWGAIDKTGKWVIPATFPTIINRQNVRFQPDEFIQAMQKIRPNRYSKKDYDNGTDRGLRRMRKRAHREHERDTKAALAGYKIIYENNQYGIQNKTGKWIIQPQFDEVHPYGKGMFGVVQDKKLGFIRLKTSK